MEIEKNCFYKNFKPKNISKMIQEFDGFDFRICIWENKGIWRIDGNDFITPIFRQLILEIKPQIIEFVREGFSRKTCEKFNQDFKFMRRLAFGIAKFEDIQKALFYANGWKGLIGLELAKIELKLFYKKQGRLPKRRDMDIISNANIRKYKYWRNFGIYTWNDLMKQTFGEVNAEHHLYDGIEGLQNAVQQLLEFKRINKRLPNLQDKDKEIKAYYNAIVRGLWKEFGINSWNDLMNRAFGKINAIKKLWTGEGGFERAQARLKEFYEKEGKLPSRRTPGMAGIFKAIQRGKYSEYGINKWNDLVYHIFGEVNQ
ncbi:MAG: hypothetical protein ACTSR8_09235 [Promethearchaeota archaeon]